MKKLITAIIFTAICLTSKSQSKDDTLQVREIKVQDNRHGPFHKMKIDYLIKRNGEYVVVRRGRELGHIHELPIVETSTAKK